MELADCTEFSISEASVLVTSGSKMKATQDQHNLVVNSFESPGSVAACLVGMQKVPGWASDQDSPPEAPESVSLSVQSWPPMSQSTVKLPSFGGLHASPLTRKQDLYGDFGKQLRPG